MTSWAPITDWDDAYANRAHVPDAPRIIETWGPDATAFRAALGERARIAVPYGPGPRQTMDIFLPERPPKGLIVFIHGGYWYLFDKTYWSHFAAGALAHGFAVAIPEYPLSPQARIPEITASIGRAIAQLAKEFDGPIRVTGHSAGGHLAARMICDTSPLPVDLRRRIDRVVPISGLFDLRPMLRLDMNADWQLDMAEAIAESPAFHLPDTHPVISAWVGGAERPEFLRQTALLANIWIGCGARISEHIDDGKHHFDIIDGLKDPDHPLTRALTQ